ncbi:hypothetical protein SESBI_01763 [Sesbania bispinosa]|nr:hypothetical protein SESBI_01763 [Sesbania bispinosa]
MCVVQAAPATPTVHSAIAAVKRGQPHSLVTAPCRRSASPSSRPSRPHRSHASRLSATSFFLILAAIRSPSSTVCGPPNGHPLCTCVAQAFAPPFLCFPLFFNLVIVNPKV